MSTIVLGCDRNQGNDSEWQNTVAKALEKEGHTVEKLSIDPGPFASYSYGENGENPSGKIGVYIMADSLVSVADLAFGGTGFKYGYFIIRGDLGRPKMDSWEDFNNNPIGRDSDCTSICDKIAGKTYKEMNDICKDKCQITFAKTPKEGADNLIKLMGGEGVSSDSSETKSTSGSTIKEALKKAVSGWDGDAEIRIENDTVYVNKIKDPTTTKIVINEFTNVQFDSVTITDVNPKTINKLTCKYKGYELTLQDDLLIKRFGENAETIEVDNFVKNYKDAVSFLQRAWNKIRRDDGRQVELKVNGNTKWKTGIWARVYLPSFYIDDYMYITRMSADEDGSTPWTTGLTLVDYPPSFGTYTEEESTEEETEGDTETTEETT